MSYTSRLVLGAAAAALVATTAMAASMHEAREAAMKGIGGQVGILFGMAQEKAPYDAAAASAAAASLLEKSKFNVDELFPAGDATGKALPAIWENWDDFKAHAAALVTAAEGVNAVAGNGLDALKGAIGPVGAACGSCHEKYRKSE